MKRYTEKDPDYRPKRLGEVLRWAIWDRLTGRRTIEPPGPGAPHVDDRAGVDPASAFEGATETVTWLGHASFLLRLGDAKVLIDPVLAPRIGPVRRHVRPGLSVEGLPPVDLLLVTHSHYDHLDAWTIRRLDRSIAVRVPLGLGGFFRRRGFENVEELDWWQSTEVDTPGGNLRVTLVPARHWSSRFGPIDLNTSLWGGFVIEGQGREGQGSAVYHAGDTGFFEHFERIGEIADLDLALLPIGAYEPAWFMEPQHMNPEQAARAFFETGARRMVPMHWGTFQLTDESLLAPIERLREFWREEDPGDDRELWELAVGETRSF